MRQNVNKFRVVLRMLTLALLLIVMLVFTPGPVRADDPDSRPIADTSGIGTVGSGLSGSGETVDSNISRSGAGNIIFTQLPIASTDQDWRAWTSATNTFWGDILCLDDFWGLTDPIDDIHWYGLTMFWDDNNENSGYLTGDPSGMLFDIIFYQDSSSSPGAKVAEFSNISPAFKYYATYHYANIDYPAYRFDVSGLDLPAGLTEGWVSIQSTHSPINSQFLWLISPTGNNNAMQIVDSNTPDDTVGNFSFALTKAPPPVPSVSLWGSTILVIFFSIILVCVIQRRQIRSRLHWRNADLRH
jgi:hypothetical protein